MSRRRIHLRSAIRLRFASDHARLLDGYSNPGVQRLAGAGTFGARRFGKRVFISDVYLSGSYCVRLGPSDPGAGRCAGHAGDLTDGAALGAAATHVRILGHYQSGSMSWRHDAMTNSHAGSGLGDALLQDKGVVIPDVPNSDLSL